MSKGVVGGVTLALGTHVVDPEEARGAVALGSDDVVDLVGSTGQPAHRKGRIEEEPGGALLAHSVD